MTENKIEKLRITSRGYELAASGYLSVATHLRHLEHIRWNTISTSEKLPLRKFWMLGVVRAQVLEIYEPVSFNVELELSMWLSRLGRTSMDFSHDIVRVSDGALVGRSTATIVALDSDRRPATIGEGASDYLVTRESITPDRFDDVTPPPEDAWERAVGLRPSDHDLQQHVNHARYAELIEDTRLLCAAANGYGPGTWDGRARRFSIAYEQEARMGDAVVAHTWVTRPEAGARGVDIRLSKGNGGVVTRARIAV
ncbi:MAG TPA: hotdog domain-containing protein [Polyangiaceae bacterium]